MLVITGKHPNKHLNMDHQTSESMQLSRLLVRIVKKKCESKDMSNLPIATHAPLKLFSTITKFKFNKTEVNEADN